MTTQIQRDPSGELTMMTLIATGVGGILLKPAWAALAMSTSTVTVTVNALPLRR